MREAARAGGFLLRKRLQVVRLFSGNVKDFHSGAEGDRLRRRVCDDGQRVGCRRISDFGSGSFEGFLERRYCSAAMAADMERTSEGGSGVLWGEGSAGLNPRDSDSGVERISDDSLEDRVVDRIGGEVVRNDLAPRILTASIREEVEVAIEREGLRELIQDAVREDESSTKRLKVEAAVAIPPHVARAWDHWTKLGAPKLVVAPMVDQSELPFRMLCRKYGATAAYTPMLHSRLFAEDAKYRKEFTTCPEDRPLFVQFCANNPETLLEAARLVQDDCDYVDINFGCPQRIAKRGNYGAFLMDDLPLIRSLVVKLATGLTTPVSCKIRMFPKLEDTLAYACMLEEAGCSLLAVHGRTRDQKNGKAIRADWEVIKAVKSTLRIPVLANGNIRWLEDVEECIKMTGVDGVMSAESLLENPALFGGYRMKPLEDSLSEEPLNDLSRRGSCDGSCDEPSLVLEYLDLCEKYPVPARMIRAHVHRILGPWFRRYPEVREELNKEHKISTQWLKDMVHRLIAQHNASSVVLGVPRETATIKQDVVSNGVALQAQVVRPQSNGELLDSVTLALPSVVHSTPTLV